MDTPVRLLCRLLCVALLLAFVSCGGGGGDEDGPNPETAQIWITNNGELYWDEFIFREAGTTDADWRFVGTGLPWTGFPRMLTCYLGSAVPPGVERYPFSEGVLEGQEIEVDIRGYARCRPPNCGSVDPRRCHTQVKTWSGVSLSLDEDTELVID